MQTHEKADIKRSLAKREFKKIASTETFKGE